MQCQPPNKYDGEYHYLSRASIASALQISFYGSEDTRLQIVRFLREKQMFLVMDNFEHLLDGTNLLTEIL